MFRIDQTGLPTGTLNVSRTDGLATGAYITITYVGRGTFRPRLLWVPTGDTGSESTLAESSPGIWTFTPTAGKYGTYRIEGIENEGKSSERRVRRLFRVRTPAGLIIPAFGERANSLATLTNASAASIEESEDNAIDYSDADMNDRPWAGSQRAAEEHVMALDVAGALAGAVSLYIRKVTTVATLLGIRPTRSGFASLFTLSTVGGTNILTVSWPNGTLRTGILPPRATLVSTAGMALGSPQLYQDVDGSTNYVEIHGYASGGTTLSSYTVRLDIDGEGTFTD